MHALLISVSLLFFWLTFLLLLVWITTITLRLFPVQSGAEEKSQRNLGGFVFGQNFWFEFLDISNDKSKRFPKNKRRALSIQPYISEFLKRRCMLWIFLCKVSGNPKVVQLLTIRSIRLKIPEISNKNQMTQNFPVKFFKNLFLTTEVILFTRHCGKCCSIGHQKFGEGKPELLVEWKASESFKTLETSNAFDFLEFSADRLSHFGN